jgi:hypothetical protein
MRTTFSLINVKRDVQHLHRKCAVHKARAIMIKRWCGFVIVMGRAIVFHMPPLLWDHSSSRVGYWFDSLIYDVALYIRVCYMGWC